MKEITTKKMFFKQLEKKLRFKYNKGDISSILGDYDEFFDIEIAQGKSESEVCMALGDPTVIVQNLNLEMKSENTFSKKLLLKKRISQGIFAVIICAIAMSIMYKLDHSASVLKDLLVAYPIIALLLWMMLKESGYTPQKVSAGKNNLWKIMGAHLSCFFVIMFLLVFLNSGVPALHLEPQQIGSFVTGILYLFIFILCGIILFSIYQFKKSSIAYYSVICHALGVITIILDYINTLSSLSNLSTYSSNIMKSGYIYLETVALVALFFILTRKRGYVNESTT